MTCLIRKMAGSLFLIILHKSYTRPEDYSRYPGNVYLIPRRIYTETKVNFDLPYFHQKCYMVSYLADINLQNQLSEQL